MLYRWKNKKIEIRNNRLHDLEVLVVKKNGKLSLPGVSPNTKKTTFFIKNMKEWRNSNHSRLFYFLCHHISLLLWKLSHDVMLMTIKQIGISCIYHIHVVHYYIVEIIFTNYDTDPNLKIPILYSWSYSWSQPAQTDP